MNLEPLLQAPLAIRLHLVTAVPALLLGTWQVFGSRKGAPSHRITGYVYLVLMSVAAIFSLQINVLPPVAPLNFSPIYLFVPVTFVGVAFAVWGARTHDLVMHRIAVYALYVSMLLVASLTLLRGRLLHTVLFGE